MIIQYYIDIQIVILFKKYIIYNIYKENLNKLLKKFTYN